MELGDTKYDIPYKKQELIIWYNEQMGIKESSKDKKSSETFMKSVKQIDPNTGKVVNIFNSACEAGRYLGKSNGNHISEACRGLLDMAYGCYWEFA